MDLKAYIESGILELYVLDQLAPEDRAEVERRAEKHPEIRTELDQIESALEDYALTEAIPPNPDTLSSIIETIGSDEFAPPPLPPPPPVPAPPPTPIVEQEVPTTPPLPTAPPESTPEPRSAASTNQSVIIGILLVSVLSLIGLLLWQLTKVQEVQNNSFVLRDEVDSLRQELRVCGSYQEQLAYLSAPDLNQINLAGLEGRTANAIVFFKPNQNSTLLSAGGLPPVPPGQQYQVWAIAGENPPQSIGLIPTDGPLDALFEFDLQGLQVDAFAISLEPNGGSEQPTAGQIFVLGTTS